MIKFYMLFNTPLKGRYMMYDSIYFDSSDFNKEYEKTNNELSVKKKTELNEYFVKSLYLQEYEYC